MIVCASLEPRNAVESIQALRFGEACSGETRAIGGADGGAAAFTALVAEIDDEIAAAQAEVAATQRWERRTTTRKDNVLKYDNVRFEVVHEGVEDHAAGVMVAAEDDGWAARRRWRTRWTGCSWWAPRRRRRGWRLCSRSGGRCWGSGEYT